MPLVRFAFGAIASIFFFSTFAHALPSWPDFRRLDHASRAAIEKDVLSLITQIPESGFKTKRARFCMLASDGPLERIYEIWETSPNVSCESTRTSSVRHVWPPDVTTEGLNFAWIAFARFTAVFCEANPEDAACRSLEALSKDAHLEGKKSARLSPWHPQGLGFSLFRWWPTSAGAAENAAAPVTAASAASDSTVCKFKNNQIVLKNGKKIFIDSGPQPNDDLVSRIQDAAAKAASNEIESQKIIDALEEIRSRGDAIIDNAAAKKAWVRERIQTDGVAWIETERPSSELGETGEKYAKSFSALRQQLMQASGVSSELAREAVMASTCESAAVCLWLQDSSIRKTALGKSLPLVAVETRALKARQVALDDKKKDTVTAIRTAVAENKGLVKENLDAFMRAVKALEESNAPMDKKNLERNKALFGHPELKIAIETVFNSIAESRAIALERERMTIAKAMTLEGNGILALSIIPRRSAYVANLLEEACLGPKTPPPAASGVAKKKPAKKASGSASSATAP